jgi:two-component system KDP operon response regulator KdpE
MGSELHDKAILVVDDDVNLCQVIDAVFSQEGAQVYQAHDGRIGLKHFYDHRPDLVLLDIRMPDMSGWEVLRQIRLLADIPVIMLTTLSTNESIIRGLDNGADDFINKPFDNQILLARSRAVLRRAEAAKMVEKPITFRDDHLFIELQTRQVVVAGEPVHLTATEFRLLAYLMQHAGRVLTYRQILDHVWGSDYDDNIDYVHVYLSHLRRKLEKDARDPRYLLTEHGVGYRFERRHRR